MHEFLVRNCLFPGHHEFPDMSDGGIAVAKEFLMKFL